MRLEEVTPGCRIRCVDSVPLAADCIRVGQEYIVCSKGIRIECNCGGGATFQLRSYNIKAFELVRGPW